VKSASELAAHREQLIVATEGRFDFAADEERGNQEDQEDREEEEEEEFCDAGGGTGDEAETEGAGDEGDERGDESPLQHAKTDRGGGWAFRRGCILPGAGRLAVCRDSAMTFTYTERMGAAPENFAITYEARGEAAFNPGLKGGGMLTIDPTAGTCVFAGKQRKMMGVPVEVTVGFGEIVNARATGRRVEFDRVRGDGKRAGHFLFYCEDEATAVAVLRRLPAARDEEFVATQTFTGKLRELPGARSEWSSPTNVIIAANVAAFVAMGLLGAGWFETAEVKVYWKYGANNGAVTTNGEWWRLVTSMFLHYGLMHLLFNMWALFQVGHLVERLLTVRVFAMAYFVCGVAGSVASIVWNGDRVWSAGASGAVFGVYGMLGGFALRERRAIPRSVLRPLLMSTVWFAGFNLLYGVAHPGIDNAAHGGGFLSGLVLGAVTAMPVDLAARARLRGRRAMAGMVVGAGLIAAGIWACPKFNYNWWEALEWQESLREPIEKERAILARQQEALKAFQSPDGTHAEFIAWISEEAIPFYEGWARELGALTLKEGTDTDRERERLVELMRTKGENYRRLIADVQAGDPDAAGRYYAAEERMIERAREKRR